jgi:hypothetical protein
MPFIFLNHYRSIFLSLKTTGAAGTPKRQPGIKTTLPVTAEGSRRRSRLINPCADPSKIT